MDGKPELPPCLERFASRHYLDDQKRATLQKYFCYSPELARMIVQWYCFQDQRYGEVMAVAEMRGDDDTYWNTPNPAQKIFPFLERNYEQIASLSPSLGKWAAVPSLLSCAQEGKEAQSQLEEVLAFLTADVQTEQLPRESREGLVEFMGKGFAECLSSRPYTDSRHDNPTQERLQRFFDGYRDWHTLQLTDRTKIGPTLLRKVAASCGLPLLARKGLLFPPGELAGTAELLWEVAQAYKYHFNPQAEVKLPAGMIVQQLFDSLLEGDRYYQRLVVGKKAMTAFKRLGRLQKQLDVLHHGMKQLDEKDNLAQDLLFELSRHGRVPVPDKTGALHYLWSPEKENEEKLSPPSQANDYLSRLLSASPEDCAALFSLNEKVAELLTQYRKYGINSSLPYPREEIIHGIASFFQQQDSSKIPAFLAVLAARQCQTLEEIAECAALELPNYLIERKLGAGAFKQVYQGRNLLSGEGKAVKIIVLSPRARNYLQQRGLEGEKFILEEAAKSIRVKEIDNPHLVRVEEVRLEEHIHRYVLYEELLDTMLEKTIQQHHYQEGGKAGKVNKRKLLEHLTQLAEGLQALHLQGLVHGDLSPGNIGFRKGQLKITDFGLASSLGYLADQTQERFNFGSVISKAPELFDGAPATSKSDMWSFGIIAYLMCTGNYPPYLPPGERPKDPEERKSYDQKVRERIEQTDWKQILEQASLPPYLDHHILRRCLQRNPVQRQEISQIYEALKNPRGIIHTYYTEESEAFIESYLQKKMPSPGWITLPSGYSTNQYDYVFVINQQDDILHYRRAIAVERGNAFALFPETEVRYSYGLLTAEQRQHMERTKPSGLGALNLSSLGDAWRFIFMQLEGWEDYSASYRKRILVLAPPQRQAQVERVWEYEEKCLTLPLEEIEVSSDNSQR